MTTAPRRSATLTHTPMLRALPDCADGLRLPELVEVELMLALALALALALFERSGGLVTLLPGLPLPLVVVLPGAVAEGPDVGVELRRLDSARLDDGAKVPPAPAQKLVYQARMLPSSPAPHPPLQTSAAAVDRGERREFAQKQAA